MARRFAAGGPLRWLALACVLLALLLHPFWLGAIGDFLVARDELRQVDAIVVLAGNSPYRAAYAAELYRAGWAPRVVISNEVVLSHGVELTWTQLLDAGLVRLEIPREAIVPLAQVAQSTHHEALQGRDLMLAHGWKRAIVVTDPFHTRRASLAFRGVWAPAGLEVLVAPADSSRYSVANWWRDPNKATRVIQEYVKYPYYVLAGQF